VPHLKSIFDLSYAKVMLIQFTFFSAYFFFSIRRRRLSIGSATSGPWSWVCSSWARVHSVCAAAIVPSYRFLTALIVLAAGITMLQVAANPYVIVLGKPETASSRLNLTQAFNSLAQPLLPRSVAC